MCILLKAIRILKRFNIKKMHHPKNFSGTTPFHPKLINHFQEQETVIEEQNKLIFVTFM